MATKIPLKELCTMEITDGTHKTPTYSDQGYIFLSSKNVTSEKIDWDNVMYIPENLHLELYQRLAPQKDDILLAKNGTTGVAAIVDRDVVFDIYVSLALIRPNSEMVIPKYLLYAINSDSAKRYFNRHLKGVGVPNLHLTHIRETPINVPNIETQREIVNKLDKVSSLITKRRQQLDKLDELIKARFVEIFGDPVTNPKGWKIDQLGSYMTTLTDFSANGSYELLDSNVVMYDEPNYAVMVRTIDLEAGNLDSGVKYIDQQAYELLSKSKLYGGELIMNKIGSAGKIYIMPHIGKPASLGRNAFMFRFDERINMVFLYALLTSDYGKVEIQQYVRGAVTKTITKASTKAIRIIVPPLDLQNQFAAFVEQTEKTKTTINESLEKLETLKKALMQEYFG